MPADFGLGDCASAHQFGSSSSLHYAKARAVLDQIDPTNNRRRLSHVAIAAQLTGSFGMRTRREHAKPVLIPWSMGSSYGKRRLEMTILRLHLSPAHLLRPALTQQANQIVADLMTLLRRQRFR